MARLRTYVDHRNGMVYNYDTKTDIVEAVGEAGEVAVERMSKSLAERLTAQGIPHVLWRGSEGAGLPKVNCPFCSDTGQAYGGPCICS